MKYRRGFTFRNRTRDEIYGNETLDLIIIIVAARVETRDGKNCILKKRNERNQRTAISRVDCAFRNRARGRKKWKPNVWYYFYRNAG